MGITITENDIVALIIFFCKKWVSAFFPTAITIQKAICVHSTVSLKTIIKEENGIVNKIKLMVDKHKLCEGK